MIDRDMTIGELAKRTGVATSALRSKRWPSLSADR
jgi:hypothetical protein